MIKCQSLVYFLMKTDENQAKVESEGLMVLYTKIKW